MAVSLTTRKTLWHLVSRRILKPPRAKNTPPKVVPSPPKQLPPMSLSLCHRPKRHAGAPHRGVNRIHQPASNDSQPSVRRLRGTSGRCARPHKASRCRTPRVHLICYLNGGTKRRRRRWFLGTPRVNCCKTPPYGRRASNCLSLTFSDPTTRQRLAGPFSKRAASIRDQSLLESTLRRGRRRWAPAPARLAPAGLSSCFKQTRGPGRPRCKRRTPTRPSCHG